MQEKEVWKDIKDYKGFYQISSLGRVKSLKRIVKRCETTTKIVKEKILKGTIDYYGYCCVSFNKNGILKRHKVHQLVTIAFFNHKPCGLKLVVNHINGIKTDNRLLNLEIVTQRDNVHKGEVGESGKSKHIGVYWRKNRNRWVARIYINKKRIGLGMYVNEIDAHNAYKDKLKTLIEK